ncbi:hypothetical protein POM88_043565 [Heracleum sosnowskyi]|uniref:Pectin acetylesterase n=1 Tax=Heracleum sosnowskyi TaxID=360622 RepID=A0AAD8H283_9APIA|nr:hypothetical protein POM88_043565 [Heracleum sosnowskyi]
MIPITESVLVISLSLLSKRNSDVFRMIAAKWTGKNAVEKMLQRKSKALKGPFKVLLLGFKKHIYTSVQEKTHLSTFFFVILIHSSYAKLFQSWSRITCTEFRLQFLSVAPAVDSSKSRGMFLNSCYAHCQTGTQETWLRADSPLLDNKTIAKAVGDCHTWRNTGICMERLQSYMGQVKKWAEPHVETVDVEKVLQNEGAEAANKLVHRGKEHAILFVVT